MFCKKCGKERNIISWLTAKSCPKSEKDTILLKGCNTEDEWDDGVFDFNAVLEKEEAEQYRILREGNIELLDFYFNNLYRDSYYAKFYIESLREIIRNVPEYRDYIIKEILKQDDRPISLFKENQWAVLDYHILELLDENYSESTNKKEISEYIINKQKSVRSKTKKKSKELVKKYGLKN